MGNWKKIGNRWYKKEGQTIVKAVYDKETDTYIECGRWTKTKFNLHAKTYDKNTEIEYEKIKEHGNSED